MTQNKGQTSHSASDTMEHKLVMLGDTGVGKSSIMKQFVTKVFNPQEISTSGAAFMRHTFRVDDRLVRYSIFDTAGQEKFRSLTSMYTRGASAAVIVYDITRASSLEDVKYWRRQLLDSGVTDAICIVVGNKTDCADRQVTTADGEALARSLGCLYGECSAKTGEGVQEIFERIAREKLAPQIKPEPIKPSVKPPKGCC